MRFDAAVAVLLSRNVVPRMRRSAGTARKDVFDTSVSVGREGVLCLP